MNKVLITDPFIKEKHHSKKPLYAALVPDEIFKGSHFERRFVTPFGGVWEKLAHVVAQEYHGHKEIDELIKLKIIKEVDYKFEILDFKETDLSESELDFLSFTTNNVIIIDKLKTNRTLRVKRISIADSIKTLLGKNVIKCVEKRYDFKNTKISSGLNGINRVFMPTSDVFPTLVASDTNDYISLKNIVPKSHEAYKREFLEEVYLPKKYRKITKERSTNKLRFLRGYLVHIFHFKNAHYIAALT